MATLSYTPEAVIPPELLSPQLVGSMLEQIYPIARRSILRQYDDASKVTPYAESMMNRKKRSGQRVTSLSPPVPAYGFDTGAFRSGLERFKTIDGETLFIFSDVFYAQFLLNRFAQKSPIGPIGIRELELNLIELNITNEMIDIWMQSKGLN